MAPEIIMKQDHSGQPVDIWATGVLLYALLCGSFPFKASHNRDLYKKIVHGHLALPEYLSIGAKSLITRILRKQPEKRPSSRKILEDVWLNSEDNSVESVVPKDNMANIFATLNLTEIQKQTSGKIDFVS